MGYKLLGDFRNPPLPVPGRQPWRRWGQLDATRRLLNPLSYRLSLAAFFNDRLTKKNLRGEDVEVQVCPRFDDRFDDFWGDLARNNPRRLLAVRTREVLEWHFRYSLENNQLWIVTVVNGPRLAAYALFEKRATIQNI